MADAADSSQNYDGEGSTDCSLDGSKSPQVSSTREADPGDRSVVVQASSSSDCSMTSKNGTPLIHPPKLGVGGFVSTGASAVFGGPSGVTQPSYSNPFLPRAPLQTDLVSTGSSCMTDTQASILAPSRLNPAGAKASESDCDSGDDKLQQSKGSILTPSRINFIKDSSSVSKFQLRPSALRAPNLSFAATKPAVTSSILRPAKLPDPRPTVPVLDNKECAPQLSLKESSPVSSSAAPVEAGVVTSSTEPQSQSSALGAACPGSDNFVAELSKNNQLKDTVNTSVSSSSNFVFGQNLSQRVTGVSEGENSPTPGDEASSTSQPLVFGENLSGRVSMANGASAPLPPDNGLDEFGDNEAQAAASGGQQTLEESAREYQAKRGNKVDLKEVEVVTGEEDESNVLQANGKLFVFDSDTQTWVERGRGTVRLNDMQMRNSNANTFQSRLVMRTQGSLRVILNTKIWAGMNVERASTKAIRITATDIDQAVRVFLIMTNPKDMENLVRAIDWRIQQLKIHEDWDKVPDPLPHGEKRKADNEAESPPATQFKHKRLDGGPPMNLRKEESDSSVQDPETEASCESQASSLTVRSESD